MGTFKWKFLLSFYIYTLHKSFMHTLLYFTFGIILE